MEYGLIDDKQIEDLADRITANGLAAITADDWPVLVIAMEALAARRVKEEELDTLRAELAKHEAQISDLARRYEDDLSALRAELAARDALLREASELISDAWADAGSDILARIDALLNGARDEQR